MLLFSWDEIEITEKSLALPYPSLISQILPGSDNPVNSTPKTSWLWTFHHHGLLFPISYFTSLSTLLEILSYPLSNISSKFSTCFHSSFLRHVFHHITVLIRDLQWLSNYQMVKPKLCGIAFKFLCLIWLQFIFLDSFPPTTIPHPWPHLQHSSHSSWNISHSITSLCFSLRCVLDLENHSYLLLFLRFNSNVTFSGN